MKRLREEYFSFDKRDYFRNEVMPFTTGTSWDEVWLPALWGVVPEIYAFMDTFATGLKALGRPVDLPEGFWKKSWSCAAPSSSGRYAVSICRYRYWRVNW